MGADNKPIAEKIANLTQQQRERISHLRESKLSVKEIQGRTGLSYKVVIAYLKSVGTYTKLKKRKTVMF